MQPETIDDREASRLARFVDGMCMPAHLDGVVQPAPAQGVVMTGPQVVDDGEAAGQS